jgi:hypothetical protein
MQNASAPSDLFEHVLGRLPPGLDLDLDLDLDALATETMAIERRREITSGSDLLRLALARGPGRMSLSQTVAWAGLIGLGALSGPGLKARLEKATAFLDRIVTSLLAVKDSPPRALAGSFPQRR